MYAEVLVELKSKNIAKTFTYKVNDVDKNNVEIGKRVLVPFGHQELEGFVLNIKNNCDDDYEVKEIIKVIDEKPVLNKELLELGKFLSVSTLCSLISAYECMLPTALKAKNGTNINKKNIKYLVLNIPFEEALTKCKNKSQIEILNAINFADKLLKSEGVSISSSSVNTLIKNEIIKEVLEETYRYNKKVEVKTNKNKLTEEQQKAYDSIISSFNENKTFLLHGVTGSGKTEVYMQVIDEVVKSNKEAIMLVPEISLTPQFVEKFISRFGEKVAILHSGLSNGEKYDEWRKIERKEVSIVIGTRSAIFAPFTNIGVIIIDEEHSDTYKQDNVPRYNAKDIADYRAKYYNCPLILGSATPDLINLAKARKGIYKLLEMKNRVGESTLPKCFIVDMAEEMKKRNTIISEMLKEKIKDRLEKKEQIILLLNRRGHSTTVSCRECGYTFKCPHCDITLTYHKSSNILRCHYCGYATYKLEKCPNCNNDDLTFLGLGTEKLEKEINKMFEDARVVRMDMDTTQRKGTHEKIIKDFSDYKYDILLGTQMISKGLDFPKVSLVGIINADTTLNIPDYKANQKTFELLYQTSGRAGRSDIKGEVVIQTFNPENYTLKCVVNNDFESFYNYEMDIRRKLKYPPYYYLVSIKVASKYYEEASKEASKVANYLKQNLGSETIILGPSTAAVFKFNNIYRFQIIIKYRFDDKLIPTLKDLQSIFNTNNKVNLEIDLSPNRI
ncbi:MAG: primosomal protein N' [Bacilli bacterium]|nr:primosomal protein N' [Bacilli bacterium]